jgi:HNH endonuclease.
MAKTGRKTLDDLTDEEWRDRAYRISLEKTYKVPRKRYKDYSKRYNKKYYREHKEKAKIAAISRYSKKKGLVADLTTEEWMKAMAYFNGVCAYCGGNRGSINKEHIIPVSHNGGFTRKNIIPSCASCNQSKGKKELHEWYKFTPGYSHERLLRIIGWIYGEEERSGIERFEYANR